MVHPPQNEQSTVFYPHQVEWQETQGRMDWPHCPARWQDMMTTDCNEASSLAQIFQSQRLLFEEHGVAQSNSEDASGHIDNNNVLGHTSNNRHLHETGTRHEQRKLPFYRKPPKCGKSQELANLRERERHVSLNTAMSELKAVIPTLPSDKMNKYQTLKLAMEYIDFLSQVLSSNEVDTQNPPGNCFRESLSRAFGEWRMIKGTAFT